MVVKNGDTLLKDISTKYGHGNYVEKKIEYNFGCGYGENVASVG